jgi:hypothetical protein
MTMDNLEDIAGLLNIGDDIERVPKNIVPNGEAQKGCF